MDTVQGEIAVFTLNDGNGGQVVRAVRERKPALVFALGSPATVFARAQLPDVPLVFAMVVDYQRLQLADASLVAGIALETSIPAEFSQFKLVLPKMRRVLALHSAAAEKLAVRATEELKRLGIELRAVKVGSVDEVESAFAKNIEGCDAIWQMNDPVTFNERVFNFLRDRSHHTKIPFLASLSDEFAKAGALASVSVDFTSLGAQAATMATAILGGRPPKEVGVQEPIGAYLAVNMDVAKVLGLEVPAEALPNINKIFSSDVQETRLAEAQKLEESMVGPLAAEQGAVEEPVTPVEQPKDQPKEEPKVEPVKPARPARARDTRTIVFYDPDANHEALVRITSWFTEFLHEVDPKLKLQPVRSPGAFEKLAGAGEVDFAIMPESYVRKKQRTLLTPLLVPSAKGSVHYKKALFSHEQGGRLATIAAAVPGKSGSDVLKALRGAGVNVEGVSIIPVSKDIDALLALVFRQVDGALVVPDSLATIKPIHPGAEQSLRKVGETKPMMRPPLCAVAGSVEPDYQARVVAAVKKMSSNSSGLRAMRTLGFDAWVTFESGMMR